MKLKEVHLLSDDLNDTQIFYETKLLCSPIEKTGMRLVFQFGPSKLIFHLSQQQKPYYHFAFTIPCNQLHESFEWVKKNLEPVRVADGFFVRFDAWKASSFYFFDNNGNLLEFIAREDLNNISHHAFSTASLASISEIGVVADKAEEFANMLINEHDLQLYSKQPMQPNFAALGDDEGLLIIASKNRNWYPTDLPAKNFWMKILLESDGVDCELDFE